MQKHRPIRNLVPFAGLASLLPLLFIFGIGAKLAIASHQVPAPQAILVLGGGSTREEFAAQFAQSHPDLDIWISTGVADATARQIFAEAGIKGDRLHLDRRAVDTVTNFTTLVKDFNRQGIQHVYLITSDYHMPRARAIAFCVFGSRGIITTPVEVPSDQRDESGFRVARDVGRSVIWLMTGRTGASLRSYV